MKKQLTDEQIVQARALRAEGKSYPEIAAELDADVEQDTIRAHCLDVVAGEGEPRTRVDKPERQRKDGAVIRGFTGAEDQELIDWVRAADNPTRPNLNQLANQMGRKRHSLAARIQTLRKHKLLPAEN